MVTVTATKTIVLSQAPSPPGVDFCPLNPLPGLQRAVIGAFCWSPCPNLFCTIASPMSPPPTSPPMLCSQ
eukprot:7767411-Ditylum_brightwellii.AAC.1